MLQNSFETPVERQDPDRHQPAQRTDYRNEQIPCNDTTCIYKLQSVIQREHSENRKHSNDLTAATPCTNSTCIYKLQSINQAPAVDRAASHRYSDVEQPRSTDTTSGSILQTKIRPDQAESQPSHTNGEKMNQYNTGSYQLRDFDQAEGAAAWDSPQWDRPFQNQINSNEAVECDIQNAPQPISCGCDTMVMIDNQPEISPTRSLSSNDPFLTRCTDSICIQHMPSRDTSKPIEYITVLKRDDDISSDGQPAGKSEPVHPLKMYYQPEQAEHRSSTSAAIAQTVRHSRSESRILSADRTTTINECACKTVPRSKSSCPSSSNSQRTLSAIDEEDNYGAAQAPVAGGYLAKRNSVISIGPRRRQCVCTFICKEDDNCIDGRTTKNTDLRASSTTSATQTNIRDRCSQTKTVEMQCSNVQTDKAILTDNTVQTDISSVYAGTKYDNYVEPIEGDDMDSASAMNECKCLQTTEMDICPSASLDLILEPRVDKKKVKGGYNENNRGTDDDDDDGGNDNNRGGKDNNRGSNTNDGDRNFNNPTENSNDHGGNDQNDGSGNSSNRNDNTNNRNDNANNRSDNANNRSDNANAIANRGSAKNVSNPTKSIHNAHSVTSKKYGSKLLTKPKGRSRGLGLEPISRLGVGNCHPSPCKLFCETKAKKSSAHVQRQVEDLQRDTESKREQTNDLKRRIRQEQSNINKSLS